MKKIFKFKKTIFMTFIIICLSLTMLTSCGNKYGQKTAYLKENTSESKGCASSTSKVEESEWLISKIEEKVDVSLSEEERLKGKIEVDSSGNENRTTNYIDNLRDLINNYVNYSAVAGSDKEEKIAEDYCSIVLKRDTAKFLEYLDALRSNENATANADSIEEVRVTLNGTAGCLDTKNEKVAIEQLNNVSDCNDVYLLGALYMIQVNRHISELNKNTEPIRFRAESVGDFFAHLWNNLFIFPLAWLLYTISKIFGGYYIVGLLITTVLVRTIGWPIYAKTNDLSTKMAALQPELQKIQERYAGKNDPESQRRMQIEQAQLYKKHKIGIGGCLAPFLQFPIFMAIYRAVSRLPYTKAIEGTVYKLDWANNLKSTFFGVDLFEGRNGGGTGQLIGIIVLLVLVVGTQILSQVLTQLKQKKTQQKSQENIPEYRRQAYNQTKNATQSQMKIMLWVMILMMGMFVWQSKAGLGVYWLIGNIYSMGQMFINNKNSAKKLEKLQNKQGIYTVNNSKKESKK